MGKREKYKTQIFESGSTFKSCSSVGRTYLWIWYIYEILVLIQGKENAKTACRNTGKPSVIPVQSKNRKYFIFL